jgi:hypothetical protein
MPAKPTVPDLKAIFAQASEIARQVPKNMQEAAFNRAVDLLTSTHQPAEHKPSEKRTKGNRKSRAIAPANEKASLIDQLLGAIDSTQHPGVTSSNSVLDRALMILQIALNDHNVDGLTPPEIATILTDKFRIRTSRNAVAMALGGATNFVNRTPSGHGFSYRIMAPGEKHLAGLNVHDTSLVVASKPRKRSFRARRKAATPQKVLPSDESSSDSSLVAKHKKNKAASRNTAASSSTPKAGPKAAILGLVASGFFSKPRTGPEVQEFLKNKRGFKFGIDQIRLVMLRLVRDDKLNRDQNAKGQYEYASP